MIENIQILFHLFPWSIFAGVLIAALCSALGVYVILKRSVFIGVALSEAAALGIAAAMVLNIAPFIGATVLTLALGLGLSRPFESGRLPRDAILGVCFALAGALSILIASKTGLGLEEVKALLYGDLILTRPSDLIVVGSVFVPLTIGAWLFRRPLLYTFMDREAAKLLGIRVVLFETLYFAALSLSVAASARVAGAMLVFAYLVVSPSAALLLSRRLSVVVTLSVGMSVGITLAGLYFSLAWDLPSNQLIVGFLGVFFLLSMIWRYTSELRRHAREEIQVPASAETSKA